MRPADTNGKKRCLREYIPNFVQTSSADAKREIAKRGGEQDTLFAALFVSKQKSCRQSRAAAAAAVYIPWAAKGFSIIRHTIFVVDLKLSADHAPIHTPPLTSAPFSAVWISRAVFCPMQILFCWASN